MAGELVREIAEELGVSVGPGSVRLRELIRSVRQAKTAAEERAAIAKESAALREAFRDPLAHLYRHRNVAKLMYIHMLGYPTHFGQMETLKLIAANGFPEKRIGYLGLMILLDERQEVLMLVTNSLKNDLNNRRNPFTVGLALAALGNICSAEMARDLAPDVLRLLQDASNPYVRKKAALCAVRVLKKNPELAEDFVSPAAELLSDARHHGVALAGATLMMAICALDPAGALPKYRPLVPAICRLLKGLLQGNSVGGGGGGGAGAGGAQASSSYLSAAEHDVGGINDPFLQVRLLKLLRVLGKGDAAASDAMADVLAQAVAASSAGGGGGAGDDAAANPTTPNRSNAANAVLYEAVNTIVGVESVSGLRVMAVNALGRFLAQRGDDNMRFVALGVLCRVVAASSSPCGDGASLVQRHRATVVDCVKDGDPSIRKRALELACALATPQNVRPLARELIEYLSVCETDFKADLAARVAELAQRHAPDRRWHVDALLSVLERAGGYVREETVRGFAVLVANSPVELQAYAARGVVRALRAAGVGGGGGGLAGAGGAGASASASSSSTSWTAAAEPALLTAALWILGEFGDTLVQSYALLEGEPPFSPALSEAGVVSLVESAAALLLTPAQLRRAAAQAPMSVHSVAAKRLAAARGKDQGAVFVDPTFSSSAAAGGGAGGGSGGAAQSALLPPRVAEFALTALAKLAARLPSQAQRCAALLARHRASAPLEVQARACEFGALLKEGGIEAPAGAAAGGGGDGASSLVAVDDALSVLTLDAPAPAGGLLGAVLERMPAVDEAEYLRSHLGVEAAAGAAAAAAGAAGAGGAAAAGGGGDLADLLGPGLAAGAAPGEGVGGGAPAGGAPAAAAIGLDDLLGGGGAAVAAGAGAAAAAAAVGGGVGGLDDLLGGGVSSAPAAAPAPAAAQTFPSVVAFDKDGLKVSLSFSKPSGPASATTVVVATASNSDAAKPVSSLALQAAVPKYLTLKLEPASGTSLPANNPGATITQRMHVTNASQGSKPLALRLRIVLARAAGEAPTTEVVELGADRLPAGL